MEFWGIEVKPGQKVKCEAGDESILHLSQASLGVTKKEKGSENVPIFVRINNQKLVIGTLSADKCPQIQHDLMFDKEFELSHGSKNTSVFFLGYKAVNESDEYEDCSDDSSSEDDLQILANGTSESLARHFWHGKPSKNEKGKSNAEKATSAKDGIVAAKLKEKPKKERAKADKKGEDKVEDDSEEGSDEDEDTVESSGDSSEEEEDSSEEEAIPEKVETDKKRKDDSASKTPIPEKKFKVVTPAEIHKKGGDGKKAHVHVATPYPAKKGGKLQQQSTKSGGSVTCKSCSKAFNSENALQSHRKSKHGDAAK